MEDWIDNVIVDDIPSQYQYIAEVIGIKNFIRLTELLGGATWYIPQKNSILTEIRNKQLKKEYNGYNIKQLVSKYKISERQIYTIVGENKMQGQISLFDK